MKIALDISQIIYGTGVSRYTQNLVSSLLAIDKDNDYILFGGSLRRLSELRKYSTKIFPIPPKLADIIWNKLHIIPIEYLVGKIDVFHSSDWSQPPASAFKVTTVHDLAPIKFPKETPKDVVSAHTARLDWVKKEVDRIIVPSDSTKEDLISLDFKAEKIRVIPEAPSVNFKKQAEGKIAELKKKLNIYGKYLLAVGASERKNTKKVISAFERVRPGEDLILVLAGRSQDRVEGARGVRVLGHIDEETLITLYSGAEVLVYASLYEGFGLPILEAFASACPVVTSNVSSMPEVAGDAAVLVDPEDVDSIVDGIKEALKRKKELIKKGLARVKEFSWEKTARGTLGVYQESIQ